MGLLEFFFGKTIKIEHPFFGQLRFSGDKKNPSNSFFTGRRFFKPKQEILEISIAAGIEGPTQLQVDFFEKIEHEYGDICRSIIPVIEDEFRNWKPDFKIIDFAKEFEPVWLDIPWCESKPIIWELTFESDHDKNHVFILTMEDFTAKSVLIDG
ncbi:hypothetical protein [Ferruginibacter sp.]